MVYVGGIVAMFLFLIMTVDVNIENVEGSKILKLNTLNYKLIALFSLCFSCFVFLNLDVFLFNTMDFFSLVEEYFLGYERIFQGMNYLNIQLFLIDSIDV